MWTFHPIGKLFPRWIPLFSSCSSSLPIDTASPLLGRWYADTAQPNYLMSANPHPCHCSCSPSTSILHYSRLTSTIIGHFRVSIAAANPGSSTVLSQSLQREDSICPLIFIRYLLHCLIPSLDLLSHILFHISSIFHAVLLGPFLLPVLLHAIYICSLCIKCAMTHDMICWYQLA